MLTLAAAMLASTAALAGLQFAMPVFLNDYRADGDLGYVHNTVDRTQSVGCSSYGNAGTCYATTVDGVSKSCSTSDANMLATIRSLNPASYVYFEFDATGHCTFVEADNSSITAPKS
jgi:hypothetical protein